MYACIFMYLYITYIDMLLMTVFRRAPAKVIQSKTEEPVLGHKNNKFCFLKGGFHAVYLVM